MDRTAVYRATLRHFLAPVADLLYDDESVTEVLVNGPDEVHVERAGRLHRTDRRFASAAALDAAVRNVAEYVGRRLDDRHLSLDARLPEPEKFRVHVLTPPASRQGVTVSIRKFFRANTTLDWLVQTGSVSPTAAEYLAVMVRAHRNVLIAGGTGVGKTSLLNALSGAIDPAERVVVIEESSELRLLQPHTRYLEAVQADGHGGGMTVRELFVNSLRMRPDRIIVGEVRRGEALDMVQSMVSGHDGASSTVHASSPAHALTRLETLCLMNDVGLPVYVARAQVAAAIHVVAQVARLADGGRRLVGIAEVGGLGRNDRSRLRSVFEFRPAGRDADGRVLGELAWTGRPSRFRKEVRMSGQAEGVELTAAVFADGERSEG